MRSESGLFSVDAGIWAVSGDLRLIPGFYLPVTSHVIRLASGGLMVHSPIDFSEGTVQAIRKLGEVEKIFAPNLAHTSFLTKAHELFPHAELVGPEGLEKKIPELSFAEIVGAKQSIALAPDFEHVFVGGAPTVNEIVLRHRESGCLIVADYFFNIHTTRGFLTRPVLRFVSDALGKPTQSKLWRRFVKDQQAARQSAQDVLGLEFGRVLVSHGQPIENGRKAAEKSLAWLLEGS